MAAPFLTVVRSQPIEAEEIRRRTERRYARIVGPGLAVVLLGLGYCYYHLSRVETEDHWPTEEFGRTFLGGPEHFNDDNVRNLPICIDQPSFRHRTVYAVFEPSDKLMRQICQSTYHMFAEGDRSSPWAPVRAHGPREEVRGEMVNG